MNAQPQQLYSYHLVMSIILIMLTIYPYLFNNNHFIVAALTSDEVALKHLSISDFDIILSDDIRWSKVLTTRQVNNLIQNEDASEHINKLDAISLGEPVRKLHLDGLGTRFNLLLGQPTHLVTDDFSITAVDGDGKETRVPFNRHDLNVFTGYLIGDPNSRATVSFNERDKLLSAQIKTEKDTIVVEPTYLHKDSLSYSSNTPNYTNHILDIHSKLYNETMIVYRLEDHRHFNPIGFNNQSNHDFNLGTLCSGLNVSNDTANIDNNMNHSDHNEDYSDIFKYYSQSNGTISNYRTKRGIEFLPQPTRDKTRCTLHLVADYLFYKHVGKGDRQTTINYLLSLIKRVNDIYLPTVWETGDDYIDKFSNIGFIVQDVTIHEGYTSLSSNEDHYNMYTDRRWKAREFLDNFSKNSPPKLYCLAHLLTHRQFDTQVLGLAYVASTRFGTIGGICSPTQQKGGSYLRHNTGISTSKGISGETLITRQADLVLAHELGHNMGAEHDTDECRPSPYDGGAYLMHPFSVMGFEKNNRFLSNCSRLSIGRVIKRKGPTCFIGVVDNVCGNGIVEGDEECDGGDFGHMPRDPCCDTSCRLTAGSQCSDRHSLCCSRCLIAPFGQSCRPAEEYNCKQASYCNGSSPKCPEPPPVDDNQTCVGRGLCQKGNCVPFCEARELHSCLCTNPKDACKLCCQTSPDSSCVPYDAKAPYLPDGIACYRGICERGRCEQPIQDVVERLWDIIEDINFTTFVKFLRDNIILVVLLITIPVWLIATRFINEYDQRIKEDVMTAIMKRNDRQRKGPKYPSPFLPRLFVPDDLSNGANSSEDINIKNGAYIEDNFAHVTSV